MDDIQLKKLIKDCVSGNSKAQELLYLQFSPKLYGVCLRYSKNVADAEDILQDSFIQIFEKIKTYQFKGAFEGWLRRIVINVALQRIKKQVHYEEVTSIEIVTNTDFDMNSVSIPIETLLQMIQRLPTKYQMVFNLYVLDDYKHQEIAELLGITVGTSKSNLARARQILQQKVNDFMEEKQ